MMSDPPPSQQPLFNGKEEAPPGYTLCFTAHGIPYYKKEAVGQEDDEAANEHVREKLSIFMSQEEVERRFGVGIRLYFNFLKYLMIVNSILAVFSSISWIVYASKRDENMRQGKSIAVADLFVSAYDHDLHGVWLGFNIINILLWFSFPPIYYFYVIKKLGRKDEMDYDNPFLFSGLNLTEIKENVHFTSTQRFLRRLGSYIVFLLLLGVSFVLVYFIQLYGNPEIRRDPNVYNPYNFLITGAVVFINVLFQFVSLKLAQFEKHKTWSAFRKHLALKKITFKMVNIVALYLATALANTATPERCLFNDTGSKFLTLMIIDLFIMNVIEYLTPITKAWLMKCLKRTTTGSDEAEKPEFDVSDEYLELFYRQFIIYLGSSVFPLLPLMGLITNMLEYPLDKFRMLHICQRPKPLDLSMKRLIVMWMTIIAAVALLSWPQGAVWVLSARRDTDLPYACCNILNVKNDSFVPIYSDGTAIPCSY